MLANEKSKGMGDHEEGMDLADEIDMGGKVRVRALAAFSMCAVESITSRLLYWVELWLIADCCYCTTEDELRTP